MSKSFSTPKKSLPASTSILDDDVIYDYMHMLDPIHQCIDIPDRIKDIIDTPQFQRLRHLKQLGASYFVFPGASHNRFEHSIGVMHLARNMICKIKERQPKLNITDDEVFCVSAAGLMHDIGHGPFSHVFDHEFMKGRSDVPFRHETMSVKLIADVAALVNIKAEHVLLIQAIVSPSTHKEFYASYRAKSRGFLFEIVANEENGIDVDKMDYLLRDSRNVGKNISFELNRLLQDFRVIGDHICFAAKVSFALYGLFKTRYELFKTIYSHKAGKAIALMICDIMRLADPALHIVDMTRNTTTYLQLTDDILQQIERSKIGEDEPGGKELKKAQALMKRLQRRQLYKCCGYLLLAAEDVAEHNPKSASVEPETEVAEDRSHSKIEYNFIEKAWTTELYAMWKEQFGNQNSMEVEQKVDVDSEESLNADDVVVLLQSLSFGMETQHPMERAFLFDKNGPHSFVRHLHCSQITMIGSGFREIVIRAYVKKKQFKDQICKVFVAFSIKHGFRVAESDTGIFSSMVVSPPKIVKTRALCSGNGSPLSSRSDTSNSNTKKRSRSESLYSTRESSVDLMDQPRRHKKPRIE